MGTGLACIGEPVIIARRRCSKCHGLSPFVIDVCIGAGNRHGRDDASRVRAREAVRDGAADYFLADCFEPPLDDCFVSPCSARCLFTMREATSSSRPG